MASASTRARAGSSAASGASCTYHVGASELHHLGRRRAAVALDQAVQRLQERQVGFGARQPLGAPPPGEAVGPVAGRQLVEEVFDQGGLAEARLAGHAQQQAAARCRRLEAGPEGGAFRLAADGRPSRRVTAEQPPGPAAGFTVSSVSAASTSAAVGRRRGSFASMCWIRASRAAGTSGFSRAGGSGC